MRTLLPPLLVALLVPPSLFAQDAPDGDGSTTEAVVAAAAPAAREAWQHLLRASQVSDPAERAPISAFTLRANALRREGVQTNETEFDVAYLAPDCVRFALPSGQRTGRFGPKARDYWVQTKDGAVQKLVGRDYAEDRRQVKEMHAIARNFVALSDPATLRVTHLELMSAPPDDLPGPLARASSRLVWLRIGSPDFALFTDQVAEEGGAPPGFVAELGLQTAGEAAGLPRYAVVREEPRAGVQPLRPLFVRLDRYQEIDGFRVPTWLFVHTLDDTLARAVFGAKPAQEVYVLGLELRPELTAADFRPGS